MRVRALTVAIAAVAAGCGGASDVRSVEPSPPDTAVSTEPGSAIHGVPTTARDGSQPVATDPVLRLAIEDALLPDDAFPPPWEVQRRELDRAGYSNGPDQTDCEGYWELDALLGAGGGHAMWWVDGGNANHHVIRMADEAAIMSSLVPIASIGDDCPIVRWIEGGSFTTEQLAIDDALAFRFVDDGAGETTWVVVTTHGDLVSVLHIPLWTRADGTLTEPAIDEIERLAALMNDRLRTAGIDRSAAAASTTTAAVPQPPPMTAAPQRAGLGPLLLAQDDLPAGWALDRVGPYSSDGSESVLAAVCPAAASVDRVNDVLGWEAELSSSAGAMAMELIGEMPDAATASAAVREFSTVWECDFDELVGGATTRGGPLDVPGADLAARLVIEETEHELGARLELVLVAIGPVVLAFSEETAVAEGGSLVDDLVPIAVDRVVGGR